MATKDQVNKAWDNAKKIQDKDPYKYREDPYGNMMYRNLYGKDSEMGWEVDHIKSTARVLR